MNNDDFAEKFGRWIADDEVCIEFDDPCPDTNLAVTKTLFALQMGDYNAEEWEARGMKCPHVHIKNIKGLAELSEPMRRRYKELLIRKYVDTEFLPYVDFSLCAKHRIAEESKPHFKYGTVKIKTSHIGRFETNKIERHLLKRAEIELQKEVFEQRHFHSNSNKPGENIIEVAINHGILVGKNGMSLCPWHDDSIPSLSLNKEKGVFYCFGCQAGGNIAKFKKLLKEAK